MTNERHWVPAAELTVAQEKLLRRASKKRPFFAILHEAAPDLLEPSFQDELLAMYRDTGAGRPAHPPAQMLMLLLLQKFAGVADHEAVHASCDDMRWRLLLGRWHEDEPLCAQSTLYDFRMRLLATGMDRRVLERTIELFRARGKRVPRDLKVALDSAPLEGAGKVEDTLNLLGHASRKVVAILATLTEQTVEVFAEQAGLEFFVASSTKAALDVDWSRAQARQQALEELLEQIQHLEQWITDHVLEESQRPPLQPALERLHTLLGQDLEPDPEGGRVVIAQRVAKDRQISVEDEDMRHGRKSRTSRFDGYKRHIARDLNEGLILEARIAPANEPDKAQLDEMLCEIESQGVPVSEVHVDRGYVGADLGRWEARGVLVIARGLKLNNAGRYTKHDFEVDLKAGQVRCPAGQVAQIRGSKAQFDAMECAACPKRARCTQAKGGRSISIHPHEAMHQRFEKLGKTGPGRAKLRERVGVEHGLSHVCRRQGHRARYIGRRKNTLDVRLCASVFNLHRLRHLDPRDSRDCG